MMLHKENEGKESGWRTYKVIESGIDLLHVCVTYGIKTFGIDQAPQKKSISGYDQNEESIDTVGGLLSPGGGTSSTNVSRRN